MGEFRERFRRYMVLRGFSPKTIEGYEHAMVDLVRAYRRSPDKLSNDEIQDHLQALIEKRRLQWSTVNVYFSAYRSFYHNVLGWDSTRFQIPPRGRSGKRPLVLDRQTALKIVYTPRNIKHQALLAMVYGSGLRVSEVVHLRPSHVESAPERMMVRVEQAKGHKDRYTILSEKALELLRQYWKSCRPEEWLFFGRDKTRAMSTSAAQRVYYQACRKAGVENGRGIHTLRHCFASHLLEAGVPIYAIKRWLGHRALSTTAGYCHLSREHFQKIRSPLDDVCEKDEG